MNELYGSSDMQLLCCHTSGGSRHTSLNTQHYPNINKHSSLRLQLDWLCGIKGETYPDRTMAVVRMTLALMAILTVARMSQACLCGLRHPQENFCVADFVLSVNVIEMEEIYGNSLPRHQFPLEVKYTVDISFVFKWSDESNISDQIYLFTGGSEASLQTGPGGWQLVCRNGICV
ncbi:metalloproteinase inhibitor 2-like isoform X1 [Pecten maximus]|uniref:metalloproteinase inhibitor 2-like isoform X1 n=1 Tax=Pecten maximus TaxID=6579 RepID=UPI001458AEED|nr:metalloproteinase inhibitor 2-like isoform X1 [Pecten maximus]